MSPASRITPWRDKAVAWYGDRSPRERWLIAGLGLVALAYVVIQLIWLPMAEARAEARRDIALYERLQMRLAASDTLATPPAGRSTSPAAAVTASAEARGLSIRRLEPEGTRLRIDLQDVAYDSLILWIDDLADTHGLGVVSAEIERRPAPGMVAAQLTVER